MKQKRTGDTRATLTASIVPYVPTRGRVNDFVHENAKSTNFHLHTQRCNPVLLAKATDRIDDFRCGGILSCIESQCEIVCPCSNATKISVLNRNTALYRITALDRTTALNKTTATNRITALGQNTALYRITALNQNIALKRNAALRRNTTQNRNTPQ